MPKKKGRTIGAAANEAILSGLTDEEALAAVLEEFPQAKTTLASVKVYRSNLRREVKEGKRKPGKEGAPQRLRGGFRERQSMTPELAAQLRRTAERKRLELHEKHLQQQAERLKRLGDATAFRKRLLRRYVARVLSFGTYKRDSKGALKRKKNAGRERLAFMEANPVSEIFS